MKPMETTKRLAALSLAELKQALRAAQTDVRQIESVIESRKASESLRPGSKFHVDSAGNLRLTESSAADEEAAQLKVMESVGLRLGMSPAAAKAFAEGRG